MITKLSKIGNTDFFLGKDQVVIDHSFINENAFEGDFDSRTRVFDDIYTEKHNRAPIHAIEDMYGDDVCDAFEMHICWHGKMIHELSAQRTLVCNQVIRGMSISRRIGP